MLPLAIVFALGPSVAVEVDADGGRADEELRGWLAARLLQEGYDLVPSSDDARSTVRVSRAGTGLAVDAIGDGVRSFAVEDGPPAVQRLEVLHRALQGVEATVSAPSAATVPAPPEPGLAVRFSGARDDALLSEIANAARDAGLPMHAEPGPDDTLVCVAARGDLAEVGVGPAADGCAPADTVAAVGTDDERRALAALVMGRVAPSEGLVPAADEELIATESDETLARIIEDGEASAGDAALPPEPVAVVVEDDGELPPMHGPPRAEVQIAAEGGIVVRGAVDAGMRGRLRLGAINGIGGRFELGVVPSGAEALRVVDTFLMVGPDWQLTVGKQERVRLSFAATAGTDLHTYRSDVSSAAEVNWAVAAPVGASLALRGGSRVHMMVHPGLSGVSTHHDRRHLQDWERTAWRVGIAIGFSHGWRIE